MDYLLQLGQTGRWSREQLRSLSKFLTLEPGCKPSLSVTALDRIGAWLSGISAFSTLALGTHYLIKLMLTGEPVMWTVGLMLFGLKGQIRGLKRESIAQSIKRTLRPLLTAEQLSFVVTAYGYRSKLLHEGASIPRIHEVNTYLRDILRIVYSKQFGWALRHPVYPAPYR